MADFNSICIGGLVGAVVATEYGKGSPEWSGFQSLMLSSLRELVEAVNSASFIVGRAAYATRNGVERLGEGISEGRTPSGSIIAKSDWDSTVEAGRKTAEYLIKGGNLAMQAILEGAKIAATRLLVSAEETKEAFFRNLPETESQIGTWWGQFLKGYNGSNIKLSAGAYFQPPSSVPVSSSVWGAAPPPQQERGGFFQPRISSEQPYQPSFHAQQPDGRLPWFLAGSEPAAPEGRESGLQYGAQSYRPYSSDQQAQGGTAQRSSFFGFLGNS